MQNRKNMTSRNSVIYLFLVYLLFYNEARSYHAVVIIHGVLTGSDSMELISNRIQEVGGMAAEQKDYYIATSLFYCECSGLILLLYFYIFSYKLFYLVLLMNVTGSIVLSFINKEIIIV